MTRTIHNTTRENTNYTTCSICLELLLEQDSDNFTPFVCVDNRDNKLVNPVHRHHAVYHCHCLERWFESNISNPETGQGIINHQDLSRLKSIVTKKTMDFAKQKVMEFVFEDPNFFDSLGKYWLHDYDLMLSIAKKHHFLLSSYDDLWRSDSKFMLELLKGGGSIFYASKSLKSNRTFMHKVISDAPHLLSDADKSLQSDPSFILEVVKEHSFLAYGLNPEMVTSDFVQEIERMHPFMVGSGWYTSTIV